MAKKTKKSKSGAPARRNSMSVSGVRASRAMGAISKPFVDWCEEAQGLSAEDALVVLEPVTAFVLQYFELTPAADASSFEAGAFGEALMQLTDASRAEGGADLELLWDSLHLYVDFLLETGRWTGAPEDLEAIHQTFHETGPIGAIPEIKAPELTAIQELEGLSGTALAQRMEALLRWIGAGKDVTPNGYLKLKDIEAAAGAIGVAAKGSSKGKSKQQEARLGAGAATSGLEVPAVNSMNQVPKLVLFWSALQAAHLIDIGTTRVWPSRGAQEFLDTQSTERLWTLRDFTTKFINIAVHGESDWDPWIVPAASMEIAVLVAAAADLSPERARIPDMAHDMLEPFEADWVARLVLDRLDYLAELGLIEEGPHVKVAPAIIGCVAGALQDTLNPDGVPAAERELPGVERPKARGKKNSKAPIFQLKVSINRASPPIWRRLLVRSDATLGQLHTILQNSFEWEGYHLHNFQVGGRGGEVFGPLDADPWGEPDLDENAYTLGQVLAAEGDSMVYTYDFGDDWEHKITVEKVLAADAKAAVALCTGGRGRGPAEDSGGPWGWSNVVAAIADPNHPEHREYREWMGLSPRQTFDPRAFDIERINAALARAL